MFVALFLTFLLALRELPASSLRLCERTKYVIGNATSLHTHRRGSVRVDPRFRFRSFAYVHTAELMCALVVNLERDPNNIRSRATERVSPFEDRSTEGTPKLHILSYI